jgi:hypothetical protein
VSTSLLILLPVGCMLLKWFCFHSSYHYRTYNLAAMIVSVICCCSFLFPQQPPIDKRKDRSICRLRRLESHHEQRRLDPKGRRLCDVVECIVNWRGSRRSRNVPDRRRHFSYIRRSRWQIQCVPPTVRLYPTCHISTLANGVLFSEFC